MTSGGQCVMTSGTALMLLWFAGNWDMHTLEVSILEWMYIYINMVGRVGGIVDVLNQNVNVHINLKTLHKV